MLNQTIIMGRIGRDIEIRKTESGKSVANFSLAVDRDYKNQSGIRETDWINVVAFGRSADFTSYFEKGQQMIVKGRLQTRQWESNDGKRYVTEIVAENIYFAGPASKKDNNKELHRTDEEDDLPF